MDSLEEDKKPKFYFKKHVQISLTILNKIGLWPSGDNLYKFNFYTVYAFIVVNTFFNGHNLFQTLNIFGVYDSLEELTQTIFLAFKDALGMLKIFFFVINIRMMKQLINVLDSNDFQATTLEQIKLIRPHAFLWKLCYFVFWIPVIPTLLFLCVYPILDGSYVNYQLPFAAWYPFNIRCSPAYEIIYLYQVCGIWYVAFSTINSDSIIAAVLMAIGTQSDLLTNKLHNLSSGLDGSYSEKFVQCIKHHQKLIRYHFKHFI